MTSFNSQYMLHFEGTEIPRSRIPYFLQHFSYDFFLVKVSTLKILCIKLHCVLANKTGVHRPALRTSVNAAD